MSRDTLVDRLRGHYRIPITDGRGPAGGEEPTNPNEFVRTFQTPPIQHEAAEEITRLRRELADADLKHAALMDGFTAAANDAASVRKALKPFAEALVNAEVSVKEGSPLSLLGAVCGGFVSTTDYIAASRAMRAVPPSLPLVPGERSAFYLRSILRHLKDMRTIAGQMENTASAIGMEALADNIDWLESFLSKHCGEG